MRVSALKPARWSRYRDLARLLWKYGRSDWVASAGLERVLQDDGSPREEEPGRAEDLARDLERMGPTFIKLGQLLATRPELLPPAHVKALARLRDRCEPFPGIEAEARIAEELGVRVSKAFLHFEREPFAAASIGQVHRATLRDGRAVVVKVQRPGIERRVAEDLAVLEDLSGFLDRHTKTGRALGFREIVETFRVTLLRELDYREEAANMRAIARNLSDFQRIEIPSPIEDYTTSRILTMEYVRGQRVDALHPVTRIDLDGEALADELFHAYLHQVLVDGLFHADPHPGNVFLTPDHRLTLLDLGMVGRLDELTQNRLLRLLIAVGEGDAAEATTVALEIGHAREDVDRKRIRRMLTDLLGTYRDRSLDQIQLGAVVLEICGIAATRGLRFPPELSLLGKTLLNVDEIARTLAPHLDPNESIRRHVTSIMRRQMARQAAPRRIFSRLLAVKDFAEALPRRVDRVLEMVADNRVKIRVEAIDSKDFVRGFQKIANRITAGLVIAAMIVGASLLMQVDTTFRIFGYPGFAMVLFLGALACGVWLLGSIFFSDQ